MAENLGNRALVLASQSTIRARLLAASGLRFSTCAPHVDEAAIIGAKAMLSPSDLAVALASAKALAVAKRCPESLIIGGDQLLEHDGNVLQKPNDRNQARQRLLSLSGKSHRLVTAVVLAEGETILFSHVDTANLTMHALSEGEIDRMLDIEGDEILQSVGAYRLEGPGISLFADIGGDFFAMLGLPLVPLLSALRRLDRQHVSGALTS